MAKAVDAWKVLAHEPLLRLSENLLWARGSLPGMSLKRTMVVARRNDGKLVIHSGIALDDAGMAEIERFGSPAFLIVPNGGHRLDAPAYKKRYPSLRVFTPKARMHGSKVPATNTNPPTVTTHPPILIDKG